MTQEAAPDGFHVAKNGFVLTAAGRGWVAFLKRLWVRGCI